MLILTRRQGESLIIGDDITIVNIDKGQVKLRINATKDINIKRLEEKKP